MEMTRREFATSGLALLWFLALPSGKELTIGARPCSLLGIKGKEIRKTWKI